MRQDLEYILRDPQAVQTLVNSTLRNEISVLGPGGTFTSNITPDIEFLNDEMQKYRSNRLHKLKDRLQQVILNHRANHGPDSTQRVRNALRNFDLQSREDGSLMLNQQGTVQTKYEHKTLNEYLTHIGRFAEEPEFWAEPSFFVQREDLPTSRFNRFLNAESYSSVAQDRPEIRSSIAKKKVIVGEQKHKVASRLYLSEKNDALHVTAKHMHFGISNDAHKDKLDVVTTINSNGLVEDIYHLEIRTPVFDELYTSQISGDTLTSASRRFARHIDARGVEHKTDRSNDTSWTELHLGEETSRMSSSITPLNIYQLQQNPVLLGGPAFDQLCSFVKENFDMLESVYEQKRKDIS